MTAAASTARQTKPSAKLSADWLPLLIALGLAALVRAGVIGSVPW